MESSSLCSVCWMQRLMNFRKQPALSALPVVSHIVSGQNWHGGAGWLDLTELEDGHAYDEGLTWFFDR